MLWVSSPVLEFQVAKGREKEWESDIHSPAKKAADCVVTLEVYRENAPDIPVEPGLFLLGPGTFNTLTR